MKNHHGIIEQLHIIAQRQAEFQKYFNVKKKKWHQPYYCNLDRMISGDWILWNAVAICERTKRPPARREISKWTKIWGIFLGHALFAVGKFGRRYSDSWDWRIGKVGCIRNISQKTECERSLDNPKKIKNLCLLWQMVQQNYQEETTNFKNPLWDGNPP